MRRLFETLAQSGLAPLNKSTAAALAEVLLAGAPLALLYYVVRSAVLGDIGLDTMALPLAGLMVAFALQALCCVFSVVQAGEFAYGLGASVRLRLGEVLRGLPLGYFLRRDSGMLAETLLLDVYNVELAASTMYNKFFTALALPLIVSGVMFIIEPRLALPLVATTPPAMAFLLGMRRALDARSAAMLSARRQSAARLLEYVRGIRAIRSLNLGGQAFTRLDEALLRLRDRSIAFESLVAPLSELYSCIAALGLPLFIVLGGGMLRRGEVSLEILLLFMILSLKFYQPIMGIAPYFSMLRHLRNSAEHIAELLRATPQRGGSRTLPAGPLGVRFESVRKDFDGREVLKEISFEAAPGSTTALVGPSGAGKTTVANLLSRFMDADSGRILVGDMDVRELQPEHLHAHISLVLQDPYLFHDTALNNIRFGRPGASLEEARAAARAACCDEFISRLPQGYDTVLGEGGASLSGGERKRVAVARAILKNAPIVVLDEATASLDPENEAQMQAAFRTLLADKTVLLIAHRLSTVRGADQILFIQDGRIAERGGFEELLALGGRFRRFWDLQRSARGWRITPA